MKTFLFCLFFLSICATAFGQKGKIKAKDYPKDLLSSEESLEVTYVAWACACANWLPTHFLTDPNYSSADNAEDCVFIEAANKDVRIPEAFHVGGKGNRIRLIGQYYSDEGISRDYVQQTSELPEKGRVFRYTKVEIIRPYMIWEDEGGESVQKVIKAEEVLDFEQQ